MFQYGRSILVVLCLVLAACAASIQPVEQNTDGFVTWSDDLPEYGFIPGDELDVKLIYNPEFSDRVIVAPDGFIYLALVGPVKVLGRSPADIANELRYRYAVELRRPDVVVIPRMFSSEIIYVGGEVQRPGVLKLAHRMGVLQGILEAGGFRDTAGISNVVLIRRNCQNKPMLRVVDVRELLEGRAPDLPLHRFDVVFVPRSKVAEVNLWLAQHIYNNLAFSSNFSYTANRDITPNL